MPAQTTPEDIAINIWRQANPDIPITTGALPAALSFANARYNTLEAGVVERLKGAPGALRLQGFTHARLTRVTNGIAYVLIARTEVNRMDIDHMIATGEVREITQIN